MGEEQRQALARLFAQDEGYKAAIMQAASVEEAVRISREHGIDAAAEDFATADGELSDDALTNASGGAAAANIFPTAPWVVC